MVWITTNNKSARAITETSVLLQSLLSVNLRAPSTRGLEESPCGAASSSRCSVARGPHGRLQRGRNSRAQVARVGMLMCIAAHDPIGQTRGSAFLHDVPMIRLGTAFCLAP
jgi:hypothetical protein